MNWHIQAFKIKFIWNENKVGEFSFIQKIINHFLALAALVTVALPSATASGLMTFSTAVV